ncbi:MAG: hypothetical protein ABFS41_04005 [Myxococcota bacterium]
MVGATGEMGRRICRLLERWTPGARVIGASRSGQAERRVDITDEASVARALEGVSLLVNAVGPYVYDPGPVIRACARACVPYADLTDDAAWLAAVAEAASACGAEAAGVAVVPGCSTVPGLVSVLASRWAERGDVASLAAFLSMGSANPPSRGLLAGLLAPLGRPRPDGGRWFASVTEETISDGRKLRFGAWPAPTGGLALGARHVPLRFHAGFDRAWITTGLRLAAPVLGRLPERWVPKLAALALPVAQLARLFGTPRGVLLLRAEDHAGAELDRVELVAAADGLDVPAAPVVWLVQRLLAKGIEGGGVRDLADVVERADAVAWLREAGFELRGS